MHKYTLYIGLFDKDTKAQQFTILEAYKIMQTIVLQNVDGATISEASGIYKHDDGTVVIEPSLRVELSGASREAIEAIVTTAKNALNQESIMIETSNSSVTFN